MAILAAAVALILVRNRTAFWYAVPLSCVVGGFTRGVPGADVLNFDQFGLTVQDCGLLLAAAILLVVRRRPAPRLSGMRALNGMRFSLLVFLALSSLSVLQYASFSGDIQQYFYPFGFQALSHWVGGDRNALMAYVVNNTSYVGWFTRAPVSFGTSEILRYLSCYVAVPIILIAFVDSLDRAVLCLGAVAMGGLLFSLFALSGLSGQSIAQTRVSLGGIFGLEANSISAYLSLCIVASVTLLLLKRGVALAWVSIAGCSVAVWFSYSRMGLLALVISLYVMFAVRLFSRQSHRLQRPFLNRGVLLAAPALCILGLGAAALQQASFLGRYATAVNDAGAASGNELEGRLYVWQTALRMLNARPWSGWGPEAFRVANDGLPTHNAYLDVGVSSGYPDLVVFVLTLVFAFVVLARIARAIPGTASVLAAGGIGGLTYFVLEVLMEANQDALCYAQALAVLVSLPVALWLRQSDDATHRSRLGAATGPDRAAVRPRGVS